ncbi:hypothetical protein MNB_SM-3-36 [hydrothermal vent metagenome]|uniref:Bll4390 protein n=1 Tax=hydrothermal vent metagenome TaxID=652676 RepID=A0A1W1D3Z6_9ZZZZ
MWKHSTFEIDLNQTLINKFRKYSKIGGILFIILGLVGIFFPTIMTLSTLFFVSYLMLFAGISAGALTWATNKNDWAGWLKSLILIGVAFYMIFDPMGGVATLGLLFSIYFFIDAFSGFGIAFSAVGQKHKWAWIFNALTSFILGVLFVINWPFSSMWLVGFFVGISLFFDGIALLVGAFTMNSFEDKED